MCLSKVGQSWVDFQLRHVTEGRLCFSEEKQSYVDFHLGQTGWGLCVFTGRAVLGRLVAQTCYRVQTVFFTGRAVLGRLAAQTCYRVQTVSFCFVFRGRAVLGRLPVQTQGGDCVLSRVWQSWVDF